VNGRLRLVLCGACVAIAAFHAPIATHVFAEDLAGPYEGMERAGRRMPFEARVAEANVRPGSEELDVSRRDRLGAGTRSNRR
jgi:hypothetical protein